MFKTNFMLKIIMIGSSDVGKSTLLIRYLTHKFIENKSPTIGVEFGTRTINIDDKNVILNIWDTAGQERYRALTFMYYKNCAGAIVTFDISNRNSYDDVYYWISEIKKYNPDVCVILVGLKKDMSDVRQVTTEEINNFVKSNCLIYSEISAKYDSQEIIDDVYITLAKNILERCDKYCENNLEIDGNGVVVYKNNNNIIDLKNNLKNKYLPSFC